MDLYRGNYVMSVWRLETSSDLYCKTIKKHFSSSLPVIVNYICPFKLYLNTGRLLKLVSQEMPSTSIQSRDRIRNVSYRENDGSPEVTLGSISSYSDLESSSGGNIDFLVGEVDLYNVAKYDDFDTIDWTRDRQQDRIRFRKMKKMKKGTAFERLLEAHDAWSGWLCVLLVGLSCGLFAGVIDIGADWMSDLKEGICEDQFWFDKESCCWADNTSYTGDSCSQWKTWAQIFKLTNGSGSYVSNYFMYVLFALLFASVCVTLVRIFAPYACGSGIPEIKTMLGGFIIHGYLGFWTLVIKSLGMMLAVAAGLSLGKEGPLVHIACCCGNVFARLFPKYRQNEAKRREVLSAASAAGVSVAFGAPIGGVLFSLEEVSYYFPMKTLWRSFFCAMVAAVTLKYMNPYGTGRLVLFYVEYTTPWKFFELIPFILLGVFGGLFGVFFNKFNLLWCKLRKTGKIGSYPTTEVLIVTLITALIAYPNPFTRQNTSLVIKELFQQCEPDDFSDLCDYSVNNKTINVNERHYPGGSAGSGVIKSIWLLLLAMLFKALVTVFTFGIKVPAGLFIPTMAVGACIGRITGIGVEQLVLSYPNFLIFKDSCGKSSDNCVQPGLYAMVGAAAALGGVTRMTVSLVVIMFELTGGLFYIVPMMLAVVMSKWVADAFGTSGIYDGHITLNEYPFLDNKEEFAYTTLAEDVAKPRNFDPPISCITKDSSTIEELEILLEETSFKGFPVVDNITSMQLFGYVRRKDINVALEQAREKNTEIMSLSIGFFTKYAPRIEIAHPLPVNLRHTLDESPLQIHETTPMETVVELFRKLGLRQVLVTKDGRVTGIITKKDVIKHVAAMQGNKKPDVVRYGTL